MHKKSRTTQDTENGLGMPPRKSGLDMARSSVVPENGEVITALHEITATLNNLVKCVESTETGVKVVQQ